jgi:hypothetical protein
VGVAPAYGFAHFTHVVFIPINCQYNISRFGLKDSMVVSWIFEIQIGSFGTKSQTVDDTTLIASTSSLEIITSIVHSLLKTIIVTAKIASEEM